MPVRVQLSTSVPKPELPIDPLLLTREETAQRLRISLRKVDQLTKDGKIQCCRIDRRVLYTLESLQAFIQQNTLD